MDYWLMRKNKWQIGGGEGRLMYEYKIATTKKGESPFEDAPSVVSYIEDATPFYTFAGPFPTWEDALKAYQEDYHDELKEA